MIKKLFLNLINSINGLKEVLKEHSFKIELFLGLPIIYYIILYPINKNYKLLIITIYLLLLAFEILNTAIEKLCDKITKKHDKDIKIIKDLASSSVFIVLITLTVIIIFTIFT